MKCDSCVHFDSRTGKCDNRESSYYDEVVEGEQACSLGE